MEIVDGPALVAREARVVGLRGYATPTLEAVDRRRTQLWGVTFLVMSGLAAGMVLLSVARPYLDDAAVFVDLAAFRVGLLAVTLAFSVYVLEKEVHLRRLGRLLVDERVLSSALSNRLQEVSLLSAAGQAVNTVLDLEPTLDIILASALELLAADSGTVLLAEGGGLRVLCDRGGAQATGSEVALGRGAAGQAAATGQPVLAGSDDDTGGADAGAVMAVPLVSRKSLQGVLVVRSATEGRYRDYDLRVLTLFAEQAATAILNASLYEAERRHVAELLELNHLKGQFVAMVSHELKNPLAAVLGAARTLRRADLRPEHADQLLDMVEHQAERLSRLVREVLDARRAEAGASVTTGPVDLAAVARDMARVSGAGGRPVQVRAPLTATAVADAGAMEQVILNLIDNAFAHAAGAVELEVAREGSTVRVSVLDRGEGIPADEVDGIFDPFRRGPGARGPGSGLGLYLVRTLVEAQGGNVGVTTREGGGAVFSVRLPASAAVPAATGVNG